MSPSKIRHYTVIVLLDITILTQELPPGSSSTDHPMGGPQTTPLEQMTMPPQLASTLEHIVGQLDILTQVKSKSVTCMIVYIMYAHLWAIFVCNCYC